jgi:hypothetical protein
VGRQEESSTHNTQHTTHNTTHTSTHTPTPAQHTQHAAPARRYDEEDEALLLQADADVLQERQKQQEEWDAAAAARAGCVAQVRAFFEATYGERAAEREFSMTTVTVEQVLDVREEPYAAAA